MPRAPLLSCRPHLCAAALPPPRVQGKGSAPCPICRAPLQRADLMDSVPEEEAAPDPAVRRVEGDRQRSCGQGAWGMPGCQA